jgi:hypothetical protein
MRRHHQINELNSAAAVRNAQNKRQRRPLSAEALAAKEYVRRVMAERVAAGDLPAIVLARMAAAKK